jgi:hydroxypyruvate isomerase
VAFDLSVNLEYGFTEAGDRLEDRIAAAAAAGFRKVEIFTMAGRDVASVRAALDAHGVELWSMVNDPRTRIIDPQTHDEFRANVRQSAENAVALGCKRVVIASGPAVPFLKRAVQLQTVADAVASVVPIAEEHDLTLILEAVNTRVDHPGVLFAMTEDCVKVAQIVDSPRVRLLYDMYHSIVEGEDPEVVLPPVMHLVDHVQIADAPGRGEPGSGAIDWPSQLAMLARLGYSGTIGVECYPTRQPTGEALAYIQELCAG